MSTLGKVLIFLNVFVAVILLVIAGMNYGAAQEARVAVFRHELVITGLPVDEKEVNQTHPDEPIVEKLTPGLLADVFANANGGQDLGGGPVKTVLEELQRVQAKVKQNIENQPNEAQQREKAAGYLLMQARDIKEREELQAKLRTAPIAELLTEVDRRFQVVRNLYSLKSPPYEAVRNAAAVLFVNLHADPAWWERVRVVLGLEPLVHGLDRSSHVMQQIAAGVKEGIIRDQGSFVSSYQELVQQLMYEAENLYQAEKKLAEQQGVEKDRELELQQRKTEVERNRAELAELTAAKDAEVAKLEAMQRDLFALQQRLGLAMEASRSLEQQLRQRASGR